MDNTVKTLCDLARLLARATNRSPTTISRLVTGSGDTIRRLQVVDDSGHAVHRITTARAARAIQRLSDLWPADLAWPTQIERPTSGSALQAREVA